MNTKHTPPLLHPHIIITWNKSSLSRLNTTHHKKIKMTESKSVTSLKIYCQSTVYLHTNRSR